MVMLHRNHGYRIQYRYHWSRLMAWPILIYQNKSVSLLQNHRVERVIMLNLLKKCDFQRKYQCFKIILLNNHLSRMLRTILDFENVS